MRLLITGKPNQGSWKIRAEQLGGAISAKVIPDARIEDIRKCDVVIVVKNFTVGLLDRIRSLKKPIVWDCVDFWPQPLGNTWDREKCLQFLRKKLSDVGPQMAIAATKQMADDMKECRLPIKIGYLKHHARPDQIKNEIRDQIKVIGYEGSPRYLDFWRGHIDEICEQAKYRFVINPDHLADVDVCLALRGGEWDGYATRNWKSNVKLANMHDTGTPGILGPEAGYLENRTGAEYLVSDPRHLKYAMKWLEPKEVRQEISERFLSVDTSLESVAKEYLKILSTL